MATMIVAKARAVAELVKVELPAAAGVCVVAGEVMALGHLPTVSTAILGFLVGFLISGAAMISNDYFDYEVDKVNHPERPFPSGRITKSELMVTEAAFSLAGLVAAGILGLVVLAAAAALWVVGFLYNWRYKEAGLLGNTMVSVSVASTFVIGGMASAGPVNGLVWTFGCLAFMFDLAEEIAGGAMDVIGDAQRNVRSLARTHGRTQAFRVSTFLYILVIVGTLTPFAMDWLGTGYLVIVAVVDILIGYFAFELYESKTPQEGRRRIRHLYLTALGLVAAFLVGGML
ncbi:MAG TPA: UbiA family prenyltransferase [Conexivisphaerales archaeon]|nr:UbiA family prenyltransferase [Conexivisphaerales archaeon]